MKPTDYFQHCPRCGMAQARLPERPVFECSACAFRLYFNAGAGVAGFIQRSDGRVLFIRRAKEPGLGRLAPPGGFVDIGERAEDALVREIREEVGIEIHSIRFLCTYANEYLYAGVTYPVLDLFFLAGAADNSIPQALDAVASVDWYDPASVTPDQLAFPSMQAAWREALCDPSVRVF